MSATDTTKEEHHMERLLRARNVQRYDRIVGDSEHRIGETTFTVIDTIERPTLGGLPRLHVAGRDILGNTYVRVYEPDELVAVIHQEAV